MRAHAIVPMLASLVSFVILVPIGRFEHGYESYNAAVVPMLHIGDIDALGK